MQNEIIGSGLLGSAFKNSKSNNCIFFCSGVSNSLEEREDEFLRERNLILNKIDNSKLFVYFSSILASEQGNLYYKHKYNMEKVVLENADNYIIIRLPQVAGVALNNTLLPSFIRKIIQKEELVVYSNARRCIIDVEHVVEVFDLIFKDGLKNKVLSCCPNYSFTALDLVDELVKILKVNAKVRVVDKESLQPLKLSPYLQKYSAVFGCMDSYLARVTEKYTEQIVNLI